jgi:hypothetical protein
MLPLLVGYDSFELLPRHLSKVVLETVQSFLAGIKRVPLIDSALESLTQEIKRRFENGPGATSQEDDSKQAYESGGDDTEEATTAKVFLPWESFIQEIAEKVGWNPITVFNVLRADVASKEVRCRAIESAFVNDFFTILALKLLSYRCPREVVTGAPLPAWADQDGAIPLTANSGETSLIDRVDARLSVEFPGGNVAALKREFEEMVGEPLEHWLAGPFFERHVNQFKKRPIAWQIETEVRRQRSVTRGQKSEGEKKQRDLKSPPVFACLVYYHKLDVDLLPKLRTQYVGPLRAGFETQLRTLEGLATPTPEQQGHKLQLDQWIEEMKAFDVKLEQVTRTGFGPVTLKPALRQYAINDALLSLTGCWLRKLNEGIIAGPLVGWQSAALAIGLHPDLPLWIGEAFARLDYICGAVGPKAPGQEAFVNDPASADLAPLVCDNAVETVHKVLHLACDRWWQKFDGTVLASLKDQLKQAKAEQERVKDELGQDAVKCDYERQKELADRKDELKQQIKTLRVDIDAKTDIGKQLRSEIESWVCPEAATWAAWLGAQPLFDAIASLDGQRPPPVTIAEFIAQESAYAPDINDGVRVNIAPVQKAGLLHAIVLDSKDADKAIADRAEWRSDERRWVREGKLPQPGWWEAREITI